MFSRRQFLQIGASGRVVPTLFPSASQADVFRIAVIADTHIDINARPGSHDAVNLDCVEWDTHYSRSCLSL